MVIFMVWQKKKWWCSCDFTVTCLHDLDTAGRKSVHGNKTLSEARSNKKMKKMLFDYVYIYTTIIYTVKYIDILIYFIILHFITVTVHLKNPDLQMLTVSTHPLPILSQAHQVELVELVTLVTLVELVAACRVRTAHPAGSIAWCWSFEAITAGPGSICQELEGSLQTQLWHIMTNVVVPVVCHVSATAVSRGLPFFYTSLAQPHQTHVTTSCRP